MFKLRNNAMKVVVLTASIVLLQACGQSSDSSEEKVVIKPAPKLSNDATAYAKETFKLMNSVGGLG